MSLDKVIAIEGVELHLARPVREVPTWIGQREVLLQLLASWSLFAPNDVPLNPRLLGKPGVGKTTLACAAARELGRDIFIVQATTDIRPEDLLVTPVLSPDGGRALHGIAPGHRHGARGCVHPRRGQPHEREIVGVAGAAARPPALASRAWSPGSRSTPTRTSASSPP